MSGSNPQFDVCSVYEQWPKRNPAMGAFAVRVFTALILPLYQQACESLGLDHPTTVKRWANPSGETVTTCFLRSILIPLLKELPADVTRRSLTNPNIRLEQNTAVCVGQAVLDNGELIVRAMIWSDSLISYAERKGLRDEYTRRNDHDRRIARNVLVALDSPREGVEFDEWPTGADDLASVYAEVMRDAPTFSKRGVEARLAERAEELQSRIQRQWTPLRGHTVGDQRMRAFVSRFANDFDCSFTNLDDTWVNQWRALQSDPAPLKTHAAMMAGAEGSGMIDDGAGTSSLDTLPAVMPRRRRRSDVFARVFLVPPLEESLQERLSHPLQNDSLAKYWDQSRIDELLDTNADLAATWCGLGSAKSLLCLASAVQFSSLIPHNIDQLITGYGTRNKNRKNSDPPSQRHPEGVPCSAWSIAWKLHASALGVIDQRSGLRNGEMNARTRDLMARVFRQILHRLGPGFVRHVWRRLHLNELKGPEGHNLDNCGAFMATAADNYGGLIAKNYGELMRGTAQRSTAPRPARRGRGTNPAHAVGYEHLRHLYARSRQYDPEGFGAGLKNMLALVVRCAQAPAEEVPDARAELEDSWTRMLELSEKHDQDTHQSMRALGVDGVVEALKAAAEDPDA